MKTPLINSVGLAKRGRGLHRSIRLGRVVAGFMLVEIIIASAMITMVLLSVELYYKKVLDVSEDTTRHIQSGFLLEEGIEAIKQMRDQSWSGKIATLGTTTTYQLSWSGTVWRATTTSQRIENIFIRTFTIADVRRDASDNIAPSGTYDPGTKKVSMSVAWRRKGGNATTTESAETYIANLFTN